jgi:hypothetical protein
MIFEASFNVFSSLKERSGDDGKRSLIYARGRLNSHAIVTQSCRRSIMERQVVEGLEEGFHNVELLNLCQNIRSENRL